MINGWTIKNFKSVKELTRLDLAPLTIFAGANSSGKSTILQSILLTAQTLQNSVRSKSVILNGHISRFGTFSDILSSDSDDRLIVMGFEVEPSDEIEVETISFPQYLRKFGRGIKKIKCEFSFTDQVDGQTPELLQLQPKLYSSRAEVGYDDISNTTEIVRSKKTIAERIAELKLAENEILKSDLQSLEYEVLKPYATNKSQLYIFQQDPDPSFKRYVGAHLSHFLPNVLTLVYDKVEEEKRQFIEKLTNPRITPSVNSEDETFVNSILNDPIKGEIIRCAQEAFDERTQSSVFDKRIEVGLKTLISQVNYENIQDLKRISSYGKLFIQKLEDNQYLIRKHIVSLKKEDFRLTTSYNNTNITEYIETFFRRFLKYLGPLRDEPKPVYPLSGAFDPKDIGFKGENTAAVLEINKNTLVKYIPSKYFSTDSTVKPVVTTTLMNAILDWLIYMGVASKVDTTDKGKLGHELKISAANSSDLHDLTHVGVGVSQVLPILVLSLLADTGSTLIFEQPELHLHPKVQTRLADFFVSMTSIKKQCIVETHSEYLINRLRYQVAISDSNELADSITMYFVEKSSNTSTYRKVLINKYGVIEDWPKGFFDENEELASNMLKAAMDKRKREQNAKKSSND